MIVEKNDAASTVGRYLQPDALFSVGTCKRDTGESMIIATYPYSPAASIVDPEPCEMIFAVVHASELNGLTSSIAVK